MQNGSRHLVWPLVLAVGLLCVSPALAQQLAPRVYWPAPVGTNVLVFGYQYSRGDIITDPTLPVSGVKSQIHYVQLGYQRYLDFLGRTTSLQISAPWSRGQTEGLINERFARANISGRGDATLRASINLLGAPAMDSAGMQELRTIPRPIVGLSLSASFPTGTYDSTTVLNTGTNRWSLKPAVGIIWPLHPTWLLELEGGAWLFGDNDNFLGKVREQELIWVSEFHLIKRFKPGFWASLDATHYRGGQTIFDGVEGDNLQRNARAGFTLVFPIHKGLGLKLGYSQGISTASGGDFELYTLSFIRGWL